MRSLILERPGALRLIETEIPLPGPEELVVAVKAATTCGTDLKAFLRGHPQIPMPGPFGHEYSGIISAAGEGAKFKVGEAIMGVHSAPCKHCRWCLADQENLCESIMETKVLGSFAEYLRIPSRIASLNVFPKPEFRSFEEAALLEPLACVAQGIKELERHRALPADRVLVIGPGAIGMMFVSALLKAGVKEVVLAGRNQERLAVGEQLGAKTVAYPPEDRDFDIVVECTGQVEVWERSVEFSRRGGAVMLFGGPPGGTRASFDTHRLHYDQITLLSPFHFGTQAVATAAAWLNDKSFVVAPLISGTRTLDQADETFADLQAGRGVKYAFLP